MIKQLIFFIIITSFGYAATEIPEGFHSFGISKTVLTAVTDEVQNVHEFQGTEDEKNKYKDLCSKCNGISKFLETHKATQTKEKKTELLDLIHSIRLSVSDKDGYPIEWKFLTPVCAGHTFKEIHPTNIKAVTAKDEKIKEYKNSSDIDLESVTNVKITAHRKIKKIAAASAGSGICGGIAVTKFCFGVTAINPIVGGLCAAGCVGLAYVGKNEYDYPAEHELFFNYNHSETGMGICDNKKNKILTKDTKEFITAINILFLTVQSFEINLMRHQVGTNTNNIASHTSQLRDLHEQNRAKNE